MSTSSPAPPPRTGQCLCGTIKYSLSGPSATPIYNTICHCLNCRRSTGSAFLCASIVSKSGFVITQGASDQKTYIDTATVSGTELQRVSCGSCASMLFAYTPLWDAIVSVAAGTLDDFDGWVPDTEQWCVQRVGFVEDVKEVRGERRFQRAVGEDVEGKGEETKEP